MKEEKCVDFPPSLSNHGTKSDATEITPSPPIQAASGASLSAEPPVPIKAALHHSSRLLPTKTTSTMSKKRKAPHTFFDLETYLKELDEKMESGEAWDEIKPYDPSQEELPVAKVNIFRPGFAKGEKIITQEVIQSLLNAICDLKLKKPSAELFHMEHRTRKLLAPSYRSPIIVGVCGLAGKGKTSTINAVLSVDGLAHTSCGSVGTYVPVEYLALGEKELPYAFQVKACTSEESQNFIRNHWKDYYDGLLDEDEDALDDSDIADTVKPARDAFLALFSDLPEFEDEEMACAFLGQANSVDDPAVLPKLLEWGRERHAKLVLVAGKHPLFVHTISDLAELMEPFVQTAVSPHYDGSEDLGLESSVWPFVKLGRVALNSPLLESGIVLADLPGDNDSSAHRVKLAASYAKRCQVTLVIDEIKRAGDNESLKRNILEAWRRRREDSVTVVLTHTDEIGDQNSCKAPLSVEEDSAMLLLKDHKTKTEKRLKEINAQIKDPKNRKNQTLRRELGDAKERLDTHLIHADMWKKRILVEARNRQTKTALQTWFRDKTKIREPLPIFCVSTTHYMDLIREDDNRSMMNPPSFTPELTEIVALRRHLFAQVKKRGQEQTMINYYRCVKHLLNEMSLACTGFQPMYKRDHLLTFVQQAHESFPEQCRLHRQGFTTQLQPVIDAFNNSMKQWLRKAETKCDRWGSYNGNSYWTFMKREGVHRRPHNNKEDWNRTLLDIATAELDPLLSTLCAKGCDSFAGDLIYAFHERVDDMERDLRFNLDQTSIKLFREFFDNVQLENKAIEALVRTVVNKLKDGFLKLSHEATSLETKHSPFRKYMKQTYTSVMQAYPPRSGKAGIHNHRRAMFKKAIADPAANPYLAIKTHLEAQASVLLQAADSELKKGCDDIFIKIFHNFDLICPQQEDDGFQALERGKELRGDIEKARRILEGPAKEALLSAGIKVV